MTIAAIIKEKEAQIEKTKYEIFALTKISEVLEKSGFTFSELYPELAGTKKPAKRQKRKRQAMPSLIKREVLTDADKEEIKRRNRNFALGWIAENSEIASNPIFPDSVKKLLAFAVVSYYLKRVSPHAGHNKQIRDEGFNKFKLEKHGISKKQWWSSCHYIVELFEKHNYDFSKPEVKERFDRFFNGDNWFYGLHTVFYRDMKQHQKTP